MPSSTFMQFALQFISHFPHFIQLLSVFILKKEIFEIMESNAPTGHIILQYNLF